MVNISDEALDKFKKKLSEARTYSDLMGKNGAIKDLLKSSLEQLLEAEMTEHLGYDKHSTEGNNSGNSRNGKTNKTLKTDEGEINISVPRDRNSEFEPIAVPKHQRNLGEFEDKIISMYAKGMSTRDIQSHIEDLYGLKLSPTAVSNITDSVISSIREWQNRPLESVYPIVFLDAIHYKVKEDGRVLSKAAYTCLAVDINGYKEMLGIWIGEAESSKFWLNILNELRNRGVQDILIACVDGLKGFTEAISSVYPETQIQKCVIHQIRNSLKYIVYKDQKSFMKDLKPVYNSATEESALYELDKLEAKWLKKYPLVIRSWRENWPNLSVFFQYPEEIRKIIYTTNAVEALHRQFRKVTKSKTQFPNDEALTKMLYLSYRDISKKWTNSLRNWPYVISQFSVMFEERITKFL
jgi:transposase-like protein